MSTYDHIRKKRVIYILEHVPEIIAYEINGKNFICF